MAFKKTAAEQKQDERGMLSALQQALTGAALPDLKAIVCEFFQQIGGPKKFARELVRAFRKSKPGSMIHARITETILQAARTLTNKEEAKDANLLSDADLERELQSALSKVNTAGQYAMPEGGADEPPPA